MSETTHASQRGLFDKAPSNASPLPRLALLGYTLPLVWDGCLYEVGSAALAQAGGFALFRGSQALLALAAALVCVLGIRTSWATVARIRKSLVVITALACTAAPLCLVPMRAVNLAGIVLGGIGLAAAFLLWLDAYARLGTPRRGLGYLILSYPLSEIVEELFTCSVPMAAIGSVALPLGALALLVIASRLALPSPGAQPSSRTPGRPSPREILPLVGILLFGLVLGIMQNAVAAPFESAFAELWATLIKIAVFLALFWLLAYRPQSTLNLRVASTAILGLVVLLFFVLSVVGAESYVVRVSLSIVRKTISLLFFVLLLVIACGRQERGSLATLGFGFAMYAAGSTVGMVLDAVLEPSPTSSTFLLALVIAALIASVLLSQGQKGAGQHAKTSGEPPRAAEGISPESMDRLCLEVGGKHGLTEREIEVVQLYCRDLSRSEIAQRLCISENTARAHLKRAYGKLDVHSRAELLERLGIEIRLSEIKTQGNAQ